MPRMVQVRNLPDDVHEKLKERARAERMSLSDYIARELERLVRRRTNQEIIADAHRRLPLVDRETLQSVYDEIRAERELPWGEGPKAEWERSILPGDDS